MKPTSPRPLTNPVRIIADYTLRFMRNNKDAKLAEAKDRLEQKIKLFAADGWDEEELRQAFNHAVKSRSGESFRAACEAQLTYSREAQ